MSEISLVINNQRKYFQSGILRSVDFRKKQLKLLKQALVKNYQGIVSALKADINKSEEEAYISEYTIVMNELDCALKHISKWSKERKVPKTLMNIFSQGYVRHEPYGVCLICSPWNYPIQLCFVPLIGAIMTGNTAILYLSPFVAETNKIIKKIVSQIFNNKYVAAYEVWELAYEDLFPQDNKYDFVFFTGSNRVGRIISEQCNRTSTPFVLETGGKSPTIVDAKVNIINAAKKIARGKWLNSGQTCIAPDYLVLDEKIYDKFIAELIKQIKNMYGDNMPKIITKVHFERLMSYVNENNLIYGGQNEPASNTIHPTLIRANGFEDKSMQEEIFGPILPIITYKKIDEILPIIANRPKPLALYIFSNDNKFVDKCLNTINSGGVCINDTIMHITNHHLPFGGIEESGVGNYHGKYSYHTFTHARAVLKTSTKVDSKLFYPPWTKKKMKLLKKVI